MSTPRSRLKVLRYIDSMPDDPWHVMGDDPDWDVIDEFERLGYVTGQRLTGAGAPRHIVVTGLTGAGVMAMRELASETMSGNNSSNEHWYKKPVGVVIIGLTTGTTLLILRALAMKFFPEWFH
jgi:hypothetical protein